jgi:hypothetical protein
MLDCPLNEKLFDMTAADRMIDAGEPDHER